MPFYEFDVTASANTPASAPTQSVVRLQRGVITQWEVQIPRGVQGLTGAFVRRGDHQLVPSNPDGYIKGDDARISWDDHYVLDDEPLQLRLFVWNLDDSYPHTITFRINVLPLDQAEATLASPGLLQRIGQYLGLGS